MESPACDDCKNDNIGFHLKIETVDLVSGTQCGGSSIFDGPVDSLCYFLQINKETDCRKGGQSRPGEFVRAGEWRRI